MSLNRLVAQVFMPFEDQAQEGPRGESSLTWKRLSTDMPT